MKNKIDCVNCKYYDYNASEECDWCNLNKEETGICGYCEREFEDLEEATECYKNKAEECDELLSVNYENASEIANLKQQIRSLEEQLKNAIAPKFKIGQEVYVIVNNEIEKGKVQELCINKTDTLREDYLIYFESFCLSTDCYENCNDYFNVIDTFATREEAEKRLAELEGE